jgi:hypothetical protein
MRIYVNSEPMADNGHLSSRRTTRHVCLKAKQNVSRDNYQTLERLYMHVGTCSLYPLFKVNCDASIAMCSLLPSRMELKFSGSSGWNPGRTTQTFDAKFGSDHHVAHTHGKCVARGQAEAGVDC